MTAGRSSTGQTQLAAGTHTTATPGTIQVLTPAHNELLERAFTELRRSSTGAPVLDAMRRVGIKISILTDEEFAQQGQGDTGGFYNRTTDILYVRKSWLEKNPAATASVIAHEGMHAVDDATGLQQGALEQRVRAMSEQSSVPQAELEARLAQVTWELKVAGEARAYLIQGQILRELGQLGSGNIGGALKVATEGGNDAATYDRVFQALVTMREGGYNNEGRTAATVTL